MTAEAGPVYWVGAFFMTHRGEPAVLSSRIVRNGKPDIITCSVAPELDLLALSYGFYAPTEEGNDDEGTDVTCADCPHCSPLDEEE